MSNFRMQQPAGPEGSFTLGVSGSRPPLLMRHVGTRRTGATENGGWQVIGQIKPPPHATEVLESRPERGIAVMRKVLMFLFLLLVIFASGDLVRAADLNPSAWWRFDEGQGGIARDATGNGHDLSAFNGADWCYSGLPADNAAHLDGAYARWETPDAPGLDGMPRLTLQVWVYPEAPIPGHNLGIVTKWGPGGESDDSYALVLNPEGTVECRIMGSPAGPSNQAQIVSTRPLVLNKWTQVRIVYDGSTVKLFLNMIEDRVVSATLGSINHTTWPLYVGRNDWDGQSPGSFLGCIDEVKIYGESSPPVPAEHPSWGEIKFLYR